MTINEVYKRIISTQRWKHLELDDVWEIGKWNGYEVFAGLGDGQGSARFFLAGKNIFREATNEEMLSILSELFGTEKQKEDDGEE